MVGSGVVLTQLGGYQVVLVWSPAHNQWSAGQQVMCYLTIDAIGLGHEYELVIAGELLIANDEGHPVFGIIKHLRERRLLPLQVQVLKFNPRLGLVPVIEQGN